MELKVSHYLIHLETPFVYGSKSIKSNKKIKQQPFPSPPPPNVVGPSPHFQK